MTGGDLSFTVLTLGEVQGRLPALLDMGRDLTWETWTAEHFLAPRPRKFELSLLVEEPRCPLGYAIVSERTTTSAHLHHFIVAQAARGQGIGRALLRRSLDLASSCGFTEYSLKVAHDNHAAQQFYLQNAFEFLRDDGDYRWMRRGLV